MERLWTRNSDGGGFAFINDNKEIEVVKSMRLEHFWKQYKEARREYKEADFLLHMRIATHGSVCLDNTHPFAVDEQTVMAHNGIIYDVNKFAKGKKDDRSDTRLFVDEILPSLPKNWLDDKALKHMVETYIGQSKLMFLSVNPELKESVYILNKWKGDHADGMWFSNTFGVNPPRPFPKPYKHKPGLAPRVTKGVSALQEAAMRMEKRDKLVTPVSGNVHPFDGSNTAAVNKRRLKLQAAREELGLDKPFAWYDEHGGFFCWGCDEDIDEAETGMGELWLMGWCSCWDKLCALCEHYAAECSCAGGYSTSLIDRKEATPGQLELATQLASIKVKKGEG
jgi:hypothetical protein